MNSTEDEIPIYIVNEGAIADLSQKDQILQTVHDAFIDKIKDQQKYQDIRVEVISYRDGLPEHLLVNITYKGIYLFETEELHLDLYGNVINRKIVGK